jgi:uncharacterized protein
LIHFDPLKRLLTLEQQGLNDLDAERIFAGRTLKIEDLRCDYREVRTVYLVLLEGRGAVIIETHRHIPSDHFNGQGRCKKGTMISSAFLLTI